MKTEPIRQHLLSDHIPDVGKMVDLGSGGQRNCIPSADLADASGWNERVTRRLGEETKHTIRTG